MSEKLIIVATIESKNEHIAPVKKELEKLIAPSLKEDGCLQYDLHQDIENPAIFIFFELWESKPLWEKHMSSPHLGNFVQKTESLLVGLTINQMHKV